MYILYSMSVACRVMLTIDLHKHEAAPRTVESPNYGAEARLILPCLTKPFGFNSEAPLPAS